MGRVAVALRERNRERALRRSAVDDAVVRLHHLQSRVALWRYVAGGNVATLLTAPVIYSLILPFLLLDAWVSAYQAVCFRAWDIARVQRRAYFAIDRHKLAYLNGIEKFNCLYCSYANGLLAYTREIAGRTEQYWCPIRHARRTRHPHDHYHAFVPYGHASEYRDRLPSLRRQLKR